MFRNKAPLKYWSCGGEAFSPRLPMIGLRVPHFRLVAVDVFQGVVVTVHVFHVQALEIRRPALLDPHVGPVGRADAVAEPLVAALVDDDEVESGADPHARPVAPQVAVREPVPVGDRALMLHPGVRHLDQLVAVVLERILAEVVLEGFEHPLGLRKLLLGLLQVLRQRVEIEREVAQLVVEMHIVADVQRHTVIVDRIAHVPVPARVAVAQVLLADEPAVGDVHEPARES